MLFYFLTATVGFLKCGLKSSPYLEYRRMLSVVRNSLVIFIKRLFGIKEDVVPLTSEEPVEPQIVVPDSSPRKYNLRSRKQVSYAEEDIDID
jgi:hypothetical protein